MKLKQSALANTLAVLGALYFLICYALVLFAPEAYRAISQSWAHGADLSAIWSPRPGNFFLGLISFTGSAWLTGWLFGWVYNRLVK